MPASREAGINHSQDSSVSTSSTTLTPSSNWNRISADQARKYLVSLANLREDPAAATKFEVRFRELLPVRGWEPGRVALVKVSEEDKEKATHQKSVHEKPAYEGFYDQENAPLPDYLWRWREKMRLVWEAPDWRTRRWRIERLRHELLLQVDRRFLAADAFNLVLPPPTPAERVIEYLARCADRLAICQNELCPARYFIGKRRGMKYCGKDCSAPALQEAKRQWWHERGREWRRTRKDARREGRDSRTKVKQARAVTKRGET